MVKKVVLVGKGPSSKEIKKSDEYKIACLNNSVVLCEEVDYLFINDFEILELLTEQDWKKVKRVIIPTYPHCNKVPNPNITYKEFLEKIPNQHIEKDIYRMQTCLDPKSPFPFYGVINSVATTALYWFSRNHFTHVDYCGIDKSGGYNPIFIKSKEKNNITGSFPLTNQHYIFNYNHIINQAKQLKLNFNKI